MLDGLRIRTQADLAKWSLATKKSLLGELNIRTQVDLAKWSFAAEKKTYLDG